MTAGTTNFPGALDSHTGASPLGMGEVNNQANTLATASHTNSVTTVTVASTSKFPSKGYIVVKREIISYTGTTATTFTGCTRGVGGTTAAAFLSGTLVEQVVVAANHNDLAAAIVAIETKLGAGTGILQAGFAVGSTSSPSTTSASYADVPEMSVTFTTRGGDLLVIFNATATMETSSMAGTYALSLDGGGEVAPRSFQQDNVITYAPINIVYLFTGVSAGSHTVKARYVSNGTAVNKAYSTQRSLLVLELR